MGITNNALRRLAAGVGAAALALVGIVGVGTAASGATDNVGPDQPGAPTEGTLTINKYSGSPVTAPASPDPENLLDGVEFTVTRVGFLDDDDNCVAIDLTNREHWTGLDDLFDYTPPAAAVLTEGYCLLTGAENVYVGETDEGQVVFTLPLGVYFVQETDPGDNPIVSKVPDFFVSIPTSLGEDGDGWTYDVVADPKNQLQDAPNKTIEALPGGLVVGSEVTWNMEVPIPTLNNDEKFTEALVTDPLVTRLKLVENSTVVVAGTTTLDETTHYTVNVDADNVVTWTFTPDGRSILDQNMGEDLTISFDTTVNSVGDGTIPNKDYTSKFNGTTTPGEVVPYTYWGQLTILKTDNSTPVQNLKGAEFQVFEKTGASCSADVPDGDSIATGTSDEDGVVQWAGVTPTSPLGLWIANSDEPLTSPSKDYCVYETVVPAGHTLVPFNNMVTIKPGEAATFELTVENDKKEGPDLPLTGAQGTMVMTLGGLLLVGAGAGALVVSRRRNEA